MSDVLPESTKVAKGVAAAADRHITTMQKAWDAAVKASLAYMVVFLRRNPGTVEDDLADPALERRLARAARQARDATIPVLERSAVNGSLLGYRAAKVSHTALGDDSLEKFNYRPDSLLKSLHSDLDRIAEQFPQAVLEAAAREDEEYLKSVYRRYSMRTQMVVEASTKMHAFRSLINYMKGSNTLAKWQTTSATPCDFCQKLDGQKVEWGEPFTIKNFPVYGKVLYAPQLHPNCRCLLVVVDK